MRTLVIGCGETGQPLYEILYPVYLVEREDPLKEVVAPKGKYEIMNICFPYSDNFIKYVKEYQTRFAPDLTIIHSTVPVGTTSQIPNAVHSPILGDHENMFNCIRKFIKWIGGERAEEAETFLRKAGLLCRCVLTSEETELLKLMCLAKYGMSIAFAQYQKDVFDKLGFNYDHILEWDSNYNYRVKHTLQRPLINPPNGKIGGHCVCPGARLLFINHPNPIVAEVMKLA